MKQQRINLQNVQIAHGAQYQKKKTKNSIKKMGGRLKQTFLQGRLTNGQQEHKKIHNITSFQRKANRNYNEVSPHTGQNGHQQKNPLTINAEEDVEKRDPPILSAV